MKLCWDKTRSICISPNTEPQHPPYHAISPVSGRARVPSVALMSPQRKCVGWPKPTLMKRGENYAKCSSFADLISMCLPGTFFLIRSSLDPTFRGIFVCGPLQSMFTWDYTYDSKNPLITACGLRTCWREFGTLIPKNIRTFLAKQNQTGSCMWGTGKLR